MTLRRNQQVQDIVPTYRWSFHEQQSKLDSDFVIGYVVDIRVCVERHCLHRARLRQKGEEAKLGRDRVYSLCAWPALIVHGMRTGADQNKFLTVSTKLWFPFLCITFGTVLLPRTDFSFIGCCNLLKKCRDQ